MPTDPHVEAARILIPSAPRVVPARGPPPSDGGDRVSDVTVDVTHDEAGHAFRGNVGGEALAMMRYSKRGDALRLDHTEVDPAARGRGVGEAFVRAVLEDLRSKKTRIAVTCPFVSKFIDENPEYREMMR